jgi:hypothetical protein
MNKLRHLGGILLGAVGLLFFIGFLADTVDPQTGLSRTGSLWFFITLGCFPLICAALLLKKSVLGFRHRRCPSCDSEERAPAGLLVTGRSWWAHQFGGWILGSLWGASREKQVRCVQCDTLYFTETRGTRIAGVILWIVALCFVIGEILSNT